MSGKHRTVCTQGEDCQFDEEGEAVRSPLLLLQEKSRTFLNGDMERSSQALTIFLNR